MFLTRIRSQSWAGRRADRSTPRQPHATDVTMHSVIPQIKLMVNTCVGNILPPLHTNSSPPPRPPQCLGKPKTTQPCFSRASSRPSGSSSRPGRPSTSSAARQLREDAGRWSSSTRPSTRPHSPTCTWRHRLYETYGHNKIRLQETGLLRSGKRQRRRRGVKSGYCCF